MIGANEMIEDLEFNYNVLMWIVGMAAVGSVVGFFTKYRGKLYILERWHKIQFFFINTISSIFVAFVSFELLYHFVTEKIKVCLVISSIMAYIGSDLLILTQEKFVEKIKDKIDKL